MFSYHIDAVIRRCSVKQVLLIVFQNSQKNIYVRISFLIKLQSGRLAAAKNNITKYYKDMNRIKFIYIKRPVRMFSCSQILVVCKMELFHQMFNWFEKRSNVNIKKKTYLRKLKEGSAGTLVPLWIRNCPEMQSKIY